MAMEITGNYNNVYENMYAAQKQQASKQRDASKTETKETSMTQESTGATGNSDYFSKLAKLAESVDCRIGTTYSSAKSGKTLTINPKLLEKMQNDPEQEKETMELMKGVESMTKLMDGIYKASGWKVEYRHCYIDENGKCRSIAYVKNEFMLNLSDKLREERRKNSDKLIEKSKEKAAKKKEELQDALEEKRTEKGDKETGKAEKLIVEKISDSENGIIYMDDVDFREIIKAMKEDNADKNQANTKGQTKVGANLDLQA